MMIPLVSGSEEMYSPFFRALMIRLTTSLEVPTLSARAWWVKPFLELVDAVVDLVEDLPRLLGAPHLGGQLVYLPRVVDAHRTVGEGQDRHRNRRDLGQDRQRDAQQLAGLGDEARLLGGEAACGRGLVHARVL